MKGRTWTIGEKGEVEITYYLSGSLAEIIFSEDATPEQKLWIFDILAVKADDIQGISEYMKSLSKKVNVREVPADISFERFWTEYGNKVSKIAAEKAWKRISKSERTQALVAIRKYKEFSTNKKYDLAYPAKYLNTQLYKDFQ